jgi:hypothetical protein
MLEASHVRRKPRLGSYPHPRNTRFVGFADIPTLLTKEPTMPLRTCTIATAILLLLPALLAADTQATFFVAPSGNDANPGTKEKPFATVPQARDAVRAIRGQMTGDIVVLLGGGVYPLEQALVFEAADSGTAGHDVIYKAQADETPVISGGKPVSGWQKEDNGRWKAPAPVSDFRQLYVRGKRAIRARGEKPADLELAGEDGYTTSDTGMADWKNPADLELCYVTIWSHTRCKVQNIRHEGDKTVITMLQPYFTHAKTKEGVQVSNQGQLQQMYLENALELLDEPGEWYLDRAAKTVYYLPREGEDMTTIEVIAPALETLVALRGTLDQPVEHIRFEGITFEYGNWLRPSRIGHCEVQANFIVDSERKDSFVRSGGFENVHNENLKSPANVVLHAAKHVAFERCIFTRLGGAGLDIEAGSQANVVSGCLFTEIAGSAVQIGDVLKDDHHPDDPRKIVKNNTVTNCSIHDCCLDYQGGVGIFTGYTEGTVIAHNEITRLPYSGTSMGWGWGEEDAGGGHPNYEMPFKYDTPTPAKNNRIESNYIHHVMQSMHDGGSIYMLGNMPGTVIRANHVHDCPGAPGGIYLDEGSGFIEIVGNLVYNVTPMSYNNTNQDRKATCNEHDNFFGGKPDENKSLVDQAGLELAYRDLLEKP